MVFGLLIQLRHARAEARRSVLDAMTNSIISVSTMSLDARYISASMKAHAALGGERHPFVSALVDNAALTEEEATLNSSPRRSELALHGTSDSQRRLFETRRQSRARRELASELSEVSGGTSLVSEREGGVVANPHVMRYVDNVLAQPG